MFLSLFNPTFVALAEIPGLYKQRAIIHRQMRAAQYHPFIDAAAFTIVDAPITLLITICFTLVLYFFSGFVKKADHYL